jgi:hypothetical protein
MEQITQESNKKSSWAWLVLGLVLLLAIFLWIRSMGMPEKQEMNTEEEAEIVVEDPSVESTEILEVELESMDFSELDADLAELEEME